MIYGYAIVTFTDFEFVNMYGQWDDGKAGQKVSEYAKLHPSGNDADFTWLKIDVLNLQKSSVDFIKDTTVKAIYDDEYEYDGYLRQFYYDYANSKVTSENKDAGVIGWPVCLSPVDEISMGPLYKGHYAVVCQIPNPVIEDKDSPLRVVINMGGNQLTYNIRK